MDTFNNASSIDLHDTSIFNRLRGMEMSLKERVNDMIRRLQSEDEPLRTEDIVFIHYINLEEKCPIAAQITVALLHLGEYDELEGILNKSKRIKEEIRQMLLRQLTDYRRKYPMVII